MLTSISQARWATCRIHRNTRVSEYLRAATEGHQVEPLGFSLRGDQFDQSGDVGHLRADSPSGNPRSRCRSASKRILWIKHSLVSEQIRPQAPRPGRKWFDGPRCRSPLLPGAVRVTFWVFLGCCCPHRRKSGLHPGVAMLWRYDGREINAWVLYHGRCRKRHPTLSGAFATGQNQRNK